MTPHASGAVKYSVCYKINGGEGPLQQSPRFRWADMGCLVGGFGRD